MTPNLIYDVGMNNGDDTAYYLARGYRVVAIEADPTLAEQAAARFPDEVRDGRLTILNCAVGEADTEADFWICPKHTVWNSFNREVASRNGLEHYAIKVPVRRFSGIMAERGVPEYLKIDIEGHDHYCLCDIDAANRPRVVSWEMCGLDELIVMRERGYNAFKCVSQTTFQPLELGRTRGTISRRGGFTLKRALLRTALRVPGVAAAGRAVIAKSRGVDQQGHLLTRVVRNVTWPGGSWDFRFGGSGPIGADVGGEWKALETVVYEYYDYWLNTGSRLSVNARDWFDVHATVLPQDQAPKVINSLG